MSKAIMNTGTQVSRVAHRTRRASLLAAVVGAFAASAAIAGPQMVSFEACLESGTRLVSLPGVPGGMLTAKECTACDSQRLTFDSNTRYFIGKQAVPYARLRAAAANGDLRLDIFFRNDTHVLTRVRLAASADAIKQ